MKIKTDVLVIGGGPGGTAAAMFLIREGIKPIVLEQETFPRFHIGESMTGEGRISTLECTAQTSLKVEQHSARVQGLAARRNELATRGDDLTTCRMT